MYISNLIIQNFRNFEHFNIDLKPFTLIIGENNVGKSNLLDSIGLIFSQDVTYNRKRFLEVSDFNQDVIIKLKRKILDESIPASNINYPRIKIVATLTDWDTDQESVIGDWFSNEDLTEAKITYTFSTVPSFNSIEEINGQREFIRSYKSEKSQENFDELADFERLDLLNFPISKYHYSIHGGNNTESQANTYHLNQLRFELLDAMRDASSELVSNHRGKMLFRILNTKNDLDYQDIQSELVGLQKSIDNNTALQTVKSSITTQLDKISLNSDESNDVDFAFSLPNIEDLLKKLSLIYGDYPINIERNGTGRNNLLFISLILSFVEDITKYRSAYFRILGLEEPEAHLHPNVQDHLANNLESFLKHANGNTFRKDIQLILTSHSTNITTKIDFDKTVVLYRNGSKTLTHYVLDGFDTTSQSTKHIKYLNKYLDAINTNIFYSRKIILVEGISEKLLIPTFYKAIKGCTLEKDNCCIVNVNGLAFRHFLEIIRNGFFRKCLVITDSDNSTSAASRAQKLSDDYADVEEIYITKSLMSTFEKDLINENSTGKGKEILFKVLKEIRPRKGVKLEQDTGEDNIGFEDFFKLIENYKTDFAYSLLLSIEENYNEFKIPTYINDGIAFL